MEDKKIFQMNSGITLEELVRVLEQFLSVQKHLTTQRFHLGNKEILQCIDSDSNWKQFLGLDAALTIELEETSSGTVSVKIGNAKWLDKVGAATVGALFFSPLIIAAGIGAVRQAVLPSEIFAFIQNRTEGTNPSIFDFPFAPVDSSTDVTSEPYSYQNETAAEKNTSAVCPCCGSPVNASHAFCSKCGTKL